jgi:hypothetical protein
MDTYPRQGNFTFLGADLTRQHIGSRVYLLHLSKIESQGIRLSESREHHKKIDSKKSSKE